MLAAVTLEGLAQNLCEAFVLFQLASDPLCCNPNALPSAHGNKQQDYSDTGATTSWAVNAFRHSSGITMEVFVSKL